MAAPAQQFQVQLTRPNSSVSWGFRLQGGADFSTPLSIQLVQPSSVADQAGLVAGDGVLQINHIATETLDHEQAKAEIIRAGNEVIFLIARGAVTVWKPKVTPMSELKPGELDTHTLPGEAPPMQKTSLAANRPAVQHIGSAHNRSARPFNAGSSVVEEETHISVRDSFPSGAPHNPSYPHSSPAQQEYLQECGGVVPNVNYNSQPAKGPPTQPKPGVVHAQYNTPMGIYSPNNINDSFSQQASAMKNDFGKDISDRLADVSFQTGADLAQQKGVMAQGTRSVQPPTMNPNMKMTGPRWKQPTESCYVCKNPITGVFVKVKEHQLHADCLRCAQCRRSLKNIGYIWVGDKLYCVQHARELTRPPGGGYTAYVIDAPDQ